MKAMNIIFLHIIETLRRISSKRILSALLPFIILALVLLAISLLFGMRGGIDEYLLAFRYELPFLMVVYGALLFLMRPTVWRTFIAATPFLVLYLGMDLYYVFMHSIAKVDDLLLLPEGLIVSPLWVQVVVWVGLIGWALAFLWYCKRSLKELLAPLVLVAIAAALPVSAVFFPKQFLDAADSRGFNIVAWSDRWTVALMGRATSLMLFVAAKNKALNELLLLPVLDDPGRDPALLQSVLQKSRNIHILVLESFLDPERFAGLKFQTPPAPPQFKAMRKNMHIITSPVFGGGTAQAEFELLCGIPALELYTSAEFNMLDGTRTPCLPTMLAGVGYRTVATQSYKPDFFNSEKAYHSLGFDEIHFPTAFAGNRSTYLKHEDSKNYMFDGDLLTQNLSYVQKLVDEGKPFLNYVLGTYGHLPHETNLVRFPPKVEMTGVEKDSQTYAAVNQFYYRSGAVADYLTKLREIDPDSLIVITSDHLPPLDGGPQFYEKLGYTLSENGEYKKNIWFYYGPQHKNLAFPKKDYEMMDFILDVLTEERICQLLVCKNRTAWSSEQIASSYNNLMSLGAGIVRKPANLVIAGSPGKPDDETTKQKSKVPQVQ